MLMNDNALPIYKFTSVQLTQIRGGLGNWQSNRQFRKYVRPVVQEGSPNYGIRIVARFASYSRCDWRKF